MDPLQLALKMGGKVSDQDPLELALQFGGKVDSPEVDRGADNVQKLNATRAMLGQVGDPTKASEALGRFASNAWEVLNPLTMAKGLYQTVVHPLDTVQGIIDAHAATSEKAALAESEGRGSEGAGYRLAANIPVLGPMIADLGEQAGSGDIAGAAGKLAGFAAFPKVIGATAKGAKLAAPIVADASRAAMATRLPEAVGGITGGIVGGLAAGAPGAIAGGGAGIGAVELMRSLPSVYQAIKKGVQARSGVSGAQAEAVIMKMPPDVLAAAVEEVAPAAVSARAALKAKNTAKIEADRAAYWQAHPKPEATAVVKQPTLPAGFTMDAKAMGGPALTAEQIAAAPSDIRPIPPSKLPPVLPDPEISAAKSANGDLWDVKTGKRLQLTPEQAREAVASQPWNQGKKAAPKVEKAAEVAPVVTESAKITLQPDLVDRIGKAISPDAAWKDLRKHGAGDGKRIPAKEAREMVDAVWSKKEPGYTSIEQWMADRAERWERSKRER